MMDQTEKRTRVQPEIISREDPRYPEKLKEYDRMPPLLYLLGSLPNPQRKTVAIVGARMCSPYGRIQAFRFARELSRHGVQVISGLAMGIDTQGHKGALEGGTPTFAILGSGVDVCYPLANRPLYQKILDTGGGILSEFEPGQQALPYHFPIRNRLISALSDLVLVVEAKEKSGSLITARYALEQGKTVYALPGPVHEPLCQGTNHLLFDGAGVAMEPKVLLAELGISYTSASPHRAPREVTPQEKQILACMTGKPMSPREAAALSGLGLPAATASLKALALDGFLEEVSRNMFVKAD